MRLRNKSQVGVEYARGVTSVADPEAIRTHPGPGPRTWVSAAVSAVFAFVVNVIGVGIPVAWQDEGATWIVNQRSLPQFFSLLRDVDAVHGVYYLIMRAWQHVAGDSVIGLRMFSVVAVALGAGLAVLLASELFGDRSALWAGLAYAVLPQATWGAIEARSYVFSATAVTAAMLAFWIAVRVRRWYVWAAYSVLLAFSVHVFMFGALAFVGLGLAIFFFDRRAVRGAIISTAAGIVACVPFVVFAMRQSGQVDWIRQYTYGPESYLVTTLWGGTALAKWAGSAILVTVLGWAVWSARRRDLRAGLIATIGWLVMPTAILVAGSPIGLLYIPRYVTVSFPALALLIGFAVGCLPRAWQRWTALAVVFAVCTPAYLGWRQVDAKPSTLEAINVLDARSKPGDGLYIVKRDVNETPWAFPDRLQNLTILSANTGKDWRWKTLSQPSLPVAKIADKLTGYDRVWLFAAKYYDVAPVEADFAARGFVKADEVTTTSGLAVTLVLMERPRR